jgi:prepilin-type processing-associated H-X9-DG protein
VTDFDDIRDGLSQTVIVGEIAGRPDVYSHGKLDQVHNNAGGRISRPAWGISGSYPGILLDKDTVVNESNRGGLFSFHAGGANVAFADGSIRMISESTDSKVVVAMATRAGGETEKVP